MRELFLHDSPFVTPVHHGEGKRGPTQADFAQELGIHAQTVYKWESGNRSPSVKMRDRMAELFGVDRTWLYPRDGTMKPERDRPTSPVSVETDEHYPILLIEVSAGAGAAGVEMHEVTHTERLPGLYIRQEYGIAPRRLVSLKVRGESMNAAPAHLAPGAVIKAALLDPGAPITHGAVYVVFGPTGLQIKRLLFGEESSGDGEPVRRVCLWSDNAEHGRDWIPMETFYRDYRVVAAALKVERDL